MSISRSKSQQGVWSEQSPYLQDIYGQAQNLFGAGGPQAQNLVGQAQQAWGQQLQADPSQSPYFQRAVGAAINPMVEQFTQQVIPQLRSGAIAGGTFGGSRRGMAEGMAAQGLGRQIGDIVSQMGQGAYAQGLQARQGALGMAPGMVGLQYAPLERYAGLIGGPTTLSSSSGYSIGPGA